MSTLRPVMFPSVLALALGACAGGVPVAPDAPAAGSAPTLSWGPEAPPFNLEAVLRDAGGGPGFGLVKFRQANDGQLIVTLDAWVRDLAPFTSYRLQRAVDPTLDGVCTSSSWLTLGAGLTPLAIVTDGAGTGRAALWRDLGAFQVGQAFDIHFRVVDDATGGVALASGCHRFVISQ